jgi:hypothetical protein
VRAFLAATCLFAAAPPLLAQVGDTERSRSTLEGIDSVAVHVWLNADPAMAQRAGLREATIRTTDVELRLRQAGIKVATSSTAVPRLVVEIVLGESYAPDGSVAGYASALRASVLQGVFTGGGARYNVVEIWSTSIALTLSGRRAEEDIRGRIRDSVDQFINAYLAANPRT